MTDSPATPAPAQPAPGPYRVDGDWICAQDGDGIAIALETKRYVNLDRGRAWDRAVEPYVDYLKRIEPELEREREIRKATARLLAASWDLLVAAQFVTSNALDIDGRPAHAAVPYEFLNDLRAAIAKATAP